MTVTVRSSPARPPLLKTEEATWLDIRDRSGFLVMMIFFMPDGESFLTSSKKDADFEDTARNFEIPLKIDPQ
jgi:hypothetical protein